MALSSQSVSITSAIQATPIPVRRALPWVTGTGPVAIAQRAMQRAMPLVTASAGVALATLAAERTLASLALRAAERTGLRPAPAAVDPGIVRITVTRTLVVERITTTRR